MNLHAFHIKHLWHFYHFHALDLFSFSFGRSPVILHSLSNSPCPPFSPLGAPLFWPIFTLFCRSLCHIFDILSPTAASLLFPLSLYICSQCLSNPDIFCFCFSSLFSSSFKALTLSKFHLQPYFSCCLSPQQHKALYTFTQTNKTKGQTCTHLHRFLDIPL